MREFIRRWLDIPTRTEREAHIQLLRELNECIRTQHIFTQEALRILRSWDAAGVPSTRCERL